MLEHQPDEVNALKQVVKEFIDRLATIENEIETLKQDRKELVAEFEDRLDIKTLNAALRVVKIQQKVQHRDTFDIFVDALTDE
jgi:uncharacterized protein (UPF0335 family)